MVKDLEKTVAIYGAGIAGLSAAHELVQLGWQVSVYETNADAGGFFRSARVAGDRNTPSEYSWHGFGPWYHNAFDLLRQIPFDADGSVYERALSRPIAFGVGPDHGRVAFGDSGGVLVEGSKMFRMTWRDRLRWSWLLLKVWTANRRSRESYSTVNAAAQWRPLLSATGWSTWVACFGPWIGSDWTRVSLHHAGHFFRKQLFCRPTHDHAGDGDGPAWQQGAGSGWLLLRGPSSEYWFEHWLKHLAASGVLFHWQQPLRRLDFDGERVTGAHLESGARVKAAVHVLATDPFAAAEILARTPALECLGQLRMFKPLVKQGPHTQVSFRIAFAERLRWPRPRCALVVADSEFNLTLFAEEQVWAPSVALGDEVASLWTGTSCVSSIPGRLFGLPVDRCSKEQFVAEVKAQLLRCGSLDALIRDANGGRPLDSFEILRFEVWHEWIFAAEGIRSRQPKWVNATGTLQWQPTQATPVANLLLAGAHTKTAADVWSIEAAVESGRRAAQQIEPAITVLPQYQPTWMRLIGTADDFLYRLHGPHLLELIRAGLLVGLTLLAMILISRI